MGIIVSGSVLLDMMKSAGISISSMADRIGVDRVTLWRKIKRDDLKYVDVIKCLDVLGYRVLVYRE